MSPTTLDPVEIKVREHFYRQLDDHIWKLRAAIGNGDDEGAKLQERFVSRLQMLLGLKATPDELELASALGRAHMEIITLLNEGDFKKRVVLDLGYIVDAVNKSKVKGA